MPANKKPLKTLVSTTTREFVTREFYCRRTQFTAEEIRNAEVVEVGPHNLLERRTNIPGDVAVTFPYSKASFKSVRQVAPKQIFYYQHRPYPEVCRGRQKLT